MKTVGECLEFMLMNKVLEALCAYSMVDKPPGFLKFGLEILTEIIQNVRSTSILSNSAVHPGIN
jgi:hypothetical protein